MPGRRTNISFALFDVKPVTKEGNLDIEKIKQVRGIVDLREVQLKPPQPAREEELSREEIMIELVNEMEALDSLPEIEKAVPTQGWNPDQGAGGDFYFPEVASEKYFQPTIKPPQPIAKFLIVGLLVALLVPVTAWFGRGFEIKEDVLGSSLSAYQNLLTAKESLISGDLETAEKNISAVHSSLLAIQEGVGSIPLAKELLEKFLDYSGSFLEILGHKNPRQYLLLFQNNSEIRATGGFIGTYGILELDRGEISNLFIDGIYNADGQLHEKIIPPRPIQKISTAWSMHDSNWFADFPTSAEKIAWFYEKTGGPTVDGVISLTPTVVERLLEITGEISLPEYGVVLNSNNFVELIQYKVEVDYDKELNQPKKILADFAPLFVDRLEKLDSTGKKRAVEALLAALEEKHILTYFKNPSLQKLSLDEGWSGELKETDKDFLSVVSSNINGFKTDRVVDESINLLSNIQEDGSIINTLTITREHQGGGMEYDWWNRVNSNYVRVYLPLGSELISAKGQTKEAYHPPIDYAEHGFKEDPLVSSIENNMLIDGSGTHIFKENDKTVFGNWAYVSPGKTIALTYQYKLPFRIDLTKPTDSYSLLIQKQSGSIGSQFSHQIKFPESWRVSWQYPENIDSQNYSTDLRKDRFIGVTFEF
ncbi:MAG: DUF4012 domain-containing protein [Candidatus Portnoybacteria bacterium]